MGLFDRQEQAARDEVRPLAARMRPRTLAEFVGQRHFLAEGKLLWRMLQADRLGSVIFYGPPGTGKTSLAELIALSTKSHFARLNAASAGVKEVRSALDEARARLETSGGRTVLFIDELHHFNRTQQDVLLPDVEEGVVTLIGATTQNPFFSLVSPLVSRSRVFEFQALTRDDVLGLLRRALSDRERGLGNAGVQASDESLEFLAEICDGDARRALSALEIGVLSLGGSGRIFDLAVAQESIQKKAIQYDAAGDEHYDAASAFIKSMRGSDPDAAIYWLARMLEAGEDPRFLARRIVICAAEDVGNADPQALILAQAAAHATEFIGMPECRIPLTQAVTYIALAPKSNAAIQAIDAALDDVRTQRILPVPMQLRDAHYAGAQRLGRGEGYQYAHDHPEGWVAADYLGVEKTYYEPVDRGMEAQLRQRLLELKERRRRAASS
ncbi:MAG TPA: replication-associated recombination protein A [Planctomycetaceae bacterium]|jgi:putative ATPase|nr:replication-associated recombination protein A [Planctomycetaceae bacterium]